MSNTPNNPQRDEKCIKHQVVHRNGGYPSCPKPSQSIHELKCTCGLESDEKDEGGPACVKHDAPKSDEKKVLRCNKTVEGNAVCGAILDCHIHDWRSPSPKSEVSGEWEKEFDEKFYTMHKVHPPFGEIKSFIRQTLLSQREHDREETSKIFDWLLGQDGDFPDLSKKPHYSFRTELRARLKKLYPSSHY